MSTPRQQSPDLTNPQVRRTHEHVLSVARAILREAGPRALTFSTLGDRAQVTRQTLYRHWPTREALLTEIVVTGPHVGYPAPGRDSRVVLTAFLTTLRDGLDDPPSAASLLAIAAEAGTDPVVATVLAGISADRRDALNVLLAPAGVRLDEDDFARLVGPIIYSVLHARRAVTDRLVAATVDAWLGSRPEA